MLKQALGLLEGVNWLSDIQIFRTVGDSKPLDYGVAISNIGVNESSPIAFVTFNAHNAYQSREPTTSAIRWAEALNDLNPGIDYGEWH
jgi:hypothetical protein